MVDDDGAASPTAQSTTPQPSTSASVGTTGQTTSAPRATTPSAPATGTSAQTRRELPRTASGFALIQLLSGASFAGFVAARRLRRRFDKTA